MKTKERIIYVLLIGVLGAFILGNMMNTNSSKVAYINLQQVFNQFNLKKELATKFEKVKVTREDVLNEMYLHLEKLAKEVEQNPTKLAIQGYREKETAYLRKKEVFNEQNNVQLEKYDAQILKQLNQYVADYGEEEGVDVILGANGQGNLMYGNEKMNITNDVIAYINNKYQGNETN